LSFPQNAGELAELEIYMEILTTVIYELRCETMT
jgi:hypothetical protein